MARPNRGDRVEPERRPGAIRAAAGVLFLMAAAGLAHGVVTLASLNGIVDRLQAAAVTASASQLETAVGLLRFGAVVNTIMVAAVTVLLAVLALGLLRGGTGARIVTWVVCGVGLTCGWASVALLVVQRGLRLRLSGADQTTGELLQALVAAYPTWWIGLAGGLSAAGALGYLLVAVLLALPSAGAFYRRSGSGGGVPASTGGSAPPSGSERHEAGQ